MLPFGVSVARLGLGLGFILFYFFSNIHKNIKQEKKQ